MERDQFLNRIALGLGRGRLTDTPPRSQIGVPDHYRAQPYGASAVAVDKVARFQLELEALGGHVVIVNSVADAGDALRSLLDRLAPRSAITWDRSEFSNWKIDWLWDDRGAIAIGSYVAEAEPNHNRAELLAADVGITTANSAVANTGTLMLAAAPSRPRSVSLLPAIHIALISADQLVDRLGQALQSYAGVDVGDLPSSINFVTGPSRSGDIEGDLSVGVHGPAEIYVIVAKVA